MMKTPTKRILMATDLSEISTPLLAFGVNFARQFGAELIVLHVFNPDSYEQIMGETGMAVDQYTDYLRAEMRYQLEESMGTDVPVRLEVVEGRSVPQEILNTATTLNADLIVMGTHARTGLRRAFLGSVAEEVVRHAPAPVVVIPVSILEAQRKPAPAAA